MEYKCIVCSSIVVENVNNLVSKLLIWEEDWIKMKRNVVNCCLIIIYFLSV